LVIDDLSKHAAIHRQISLLLRRPPGREAFPGDIFYMHSRLLERAARLSAERGGGSLTALPIAETQAGNISAYIPTNLISITDGQIYLESKLFQEGQKPAINIGLSVSRVGGKTQGPAIRVLSERLKLEYAQFLELEIFTRFGQMADEQTRQAIERGRRIRAVLQQTQAKPLSLAAQIALLLAVTTGLLDGVPLSAVAAFRSDLDANLQAEYPDLTERVALTGELSDSDRSELCRWLGARIAAVAPNAAVQP
jgi:F-type H+-transporting ATPase subunit alpha